MVVVVKGVGSLSRWAPFRLMGPSFPPSGAVVRVWGSGEGEVVETADGRDGGSGGTLSFPLPLSLSTFASVSK